MPAGFRRKRAREQQRVRVDGNGLMRDGIGDAGLDNAGVVVLGHRLDDVAATLERQRHVGGAAPPRAKAALRRTVRLADQARGAFEDLVVLASGSLALGIRAVTAALAPLGRGSGAPTPGALRVHVADHLDPESFAALLARLDLRRTLFNVVSSTGDALETMSHFMIVRDRLLKELGAVAYKQHVVITTGTDGGPLRQVVNDEGFRDLPVDVDDDCALLTAAALFPVSCTGADVAEVLVGAGDMAARCRVRDAGINPAHLLAMGILLAPAPGPRVATPSMLSLHTLAAWIEQRCAGAGSAPADDGSGGLLARRVMLFLSVERRRDDLAIPQAYQDVDGVGYLGGQGLGALADLQREASEMALWSAGHPTVTLICPEITAYVVGQVVYLVEAAATLARATVGAAADDRDDARRFAYGLAGRPGYEAERAEVHRLSSHREARYVV